MRRYTAAPVSIIILSAWLGACSDEIDSHYPTVHAARRDGAFDRGWLPEIIPPDAVDIHEIHDLDTNTTWACFVAPGGPATVRTLLEQRGATRSPGRIDTGPSRIFGRVSWWPASMSEAEASIEAWVFRENARFTVRVGIDPRIGKACFHRR